MMKESNELKTLEKLQMKKKSHSKVENVEHSLIKMQKYLQPNQTNITREEAQLIVKLRCRVTEVKNRLLGYQNTGGLTHKHPFQY
mgnify:CR=1 FL=1